MHKPCQLVLSEVLKHHDNFSHCEFTHEVLSLLADLKQLFEKLSFLIHAIHSEHDVLIVHSCSKLQAASRELFYKKLFTLIGPLPYQGEITVFVLSRATYNCIAPRHHFLLSSQAYVGLFPLCGHAFTAHHFMHIPLGVGG